MDWKGESTPLLSGASGSTESLDVDESAADEFPLRTKPQHPIPPLEHREDSDTERPAGRAAVVIMPDGNIVPVSSTAAPLPSAHRADVSSVELPGPAPEPGSYAGSYSPSQPSSKPEAMADTPMSGPAPDHCPRKPMPGPAPDGHPQQMPAQHMHPAAQPMPRYPPPQPYPLHQFPPSEYQPFQPPSTVQYAAPEPAPPYTRHEQPRPQTVEKKPIRTSKTFDSNTLSDNQYYLSLCLCIALTFFCNPLAIVCCIPAFYYATKAANENKDINYDKALRFEKNAKCLNIGGFIFLVIAGSLFFLFISVGTTAVALYLNSRSSST